MPHKKKLSSQSLFSNVYIKTFSHENAIKMKNIFFPILSLFLLLIISSCDTNEPALSDLEKFSLPKLINEVQGFLDYDNIDSSFIKFEVEFHDEVQGNMVKSYSWEVSSGNFGPIKIGEKIQSDFSINSNGYPYTSFQFTFTQILTALGMTKDDIIPDTNFELTATLKRTDGKIFTIDNTADIVLGQPPFQGFFQYKPKLLNFPKYSSINGNFDLKVVWLDPPGMAWDNCAGKEWEGKITWEALHDPTDFIGMYKTFTTDPIENIALEDLSMGLYRACYVIDSTGTNLPNGDLKIVDNGGILSYEGSSQWGEVWKFVEVSPNGNLLKLEITNDYGERGTITITRNDGEIWPANLTCAGC